MKFEIETEVNHYTNIKFPHTTSNPSLCRVSQNVDWKMIAIISFEMRTPGFEILTESGFSDSYHRLK